MDMAKMMNIYEYRSIYSGLRPVSQTGLKLYPSVVPGWDNTARRPNNPALLLHNSKPHHFKEWLQAIVNDFTPYSSEENIVFINAWNEWAEGNHLEPCLRWGTQYLEAVQEVFKPHIRTKDP